MNNCDKNLVIVLFENNNASVPMRLNLLDKKLKTQMNCNKSRNCCQRVFSSTWNEIITEWIIQENGQILKKSKAFKSGLNCHWVSQILFHDFRNVLASCGYASDIKIWDCSTGCIKQITKTSLSVNCMAWWESHGKTYLITGQIDGSIVVYDFDNEKEFPIVCTLFKHTKAVNQIVTSQKNNQFLSCSDDGSVHLWCLKQNKHLKEFQIGDWVQCICYLDKEETLFASGDLMNIKVWDTRATEPNDCLLETPFHIMVKYLVYSFELGFLISNSNTHIHVWDFQHKKFPNDYQHPIALKTKIKNPFNQTVSGLILLDNDQTKLLVGDQLGNMFIVDLKTQLIILQIENMGHGGNCITGFSKTY